MKTALLFAACMLLCPCRLTWAADKGGRLDPSFKSRGRIILTDVGDLTFEAAYAMTVQPDGKIVAVGFSTPAVGPSSDFALVRYESTGRIDRKFGNNGRVLTDFSGTGSTDQAFAVAIDSIGRIVVAGYASSNMGDFAVARYNPDGTPDNSFNSTGNILTDFGGDDTATAMAIDWNDKIVVAGFSKAGGTYDFAVARYNVDGTLDTTFNGTGRVLTDVGIGSGDFATAAVIQADGKIVVGGLSDASGPYDFSLVRYNANGTLDLTFNATGKVLTDFSGSGSVDRLHALAIQSDGKLVAVGDSVANGHSNFALARYTATGLNAGTLDGTFNATGTVLTAFASGNATAQAVVIQSDGRIVAAGWFDDGNREGPDFALARYDTEGTLDNTFSPTGKVVTDIGGHDFIYGAGIQSDGKIVAAGYSDVNGTSDFALVRYLP
jgi:uncharacterized delta-60 repeat protein